MTENRREYMKQYQRRYRQEHPESVERTRISYAKSVLLRAGYTLIPPQDDDATTTTDGGEEQ